MVDMLQKAYIKSAQLYYITYCDVRRSTFATMTIHPTLRYKFLYCYLNRGHNYETRP